MLAVDPACGQHEPMTACHANELGDSFIPVSGPEDGHFHGEPLDVAPRRDSEKNTLNGEPRVRRDHPRREIA